ncbi:unnamed protein product, partial [Darwinula stevensoni]
CPDVCPTTLAEVKEAKRLLGPLGDKVQGIFVTLDPERDTPELLKNYTKAFHPSFIGLRGNPEQTDKVAQDFKVYYKKVPGKTPKTYSLDHTAAAFVYDPEGRLRLFTRYGSGAQKLADDIKKLF